MICNLEKEPTYPFQMWVYDNKDLLMMIHRFEDFGHEAEVISACVCIAFDIATDDIDLTLAKQNERL